jgi:hypothetical protein
VVPCRYEPRNSTGAPPGSSGLSCSSCANLGYSNAMQIAGKVAEEIAEAEICLRERFKGCAGGANLASTFVIKPPLHAGEAEYFVRGLESGIFSIDDEGYVQSTVLPPSSRESTRNKTLSLFWHRTGRRYLFREGVCQISTMAALKLKYGFPLDQIKMEPTFPDRPELSWAVDILLKGPQGTNVAFCEVKRDDRELERLISGFRYCCGAGSHSKNECKFSKNHPKFALCVALKPEYFMAVSPGQEVCFQLSYSGHFIAIAEVPLSSLVSKLQSST